MSDGSKDLFGKIDALFEKRAPDALVDKGLEHEDFPVLTEVIGRAPPAPVVWGEPERRVSDRRSADQRKEDRRSGDRRLADRRGGNQSEASPPPPMAAKDDTDHLVKAVESRLSDLFIRQQLRLEEVVRKVVREEMEKKLGHPANPTEAGHREP